MGRENIAGLLSRSWVEREHEGLEADASEKVTFAAEVQSATRG